MDFFFISPLDKEILDRFLKINKHNYSDVNKTFFNFEEFI